MKALASLRSLLPRRGDYAEVRRTWRGDLIAGVIVGIVALPLALAFGVSSGAGAASGLVTAVVAGFVAAVFGGSNVQVSGPTGAMVVVLGPVIASQGLAALAVVTILAELMVLAAGALKLGRVVAFLPWPVIEGFTLGIAVIIFLQQVPAAFGVLAGPARMLRSLPRRAWPRSRGRRSPHPWDWFCWSWSSCSAPRASTRRCPARSWRSSRPACWRRSWICPRHGSGRCPIRFRHRCCPSSTAPPSWRWPPRLPPSLHWRPSSRCSRPGWRPRSPTPAPMTRIASSSDRDWPRRPQGSSAACPPPEPSRAQP